jgi:hypothetical protein
MGNAIGSLVTGFVLLCAAASVAVLVSIAFRPLVGDTSGILPMPDGRVFIVFALPAIAFLAMPFALVARDNLVRRVRLTVGGWLVTIVCLIVLYAVQ